MVLSVGDISHGSQTCTGCGQIESGCDQRESQIVRSHEYEETATYIAVVVWTSNLTMLWMCSV